MPIFRFSAEANLDRPEIRITSNRAEGKKSIIRACRSAGWVAIRCETGLLTNITPLRFMRQKYDYWLSVTGSDKGVVELLPRADDPYLAKVINDEGDLLEIEDRTFPISATDSPFVLNGPIPGSSRIILHELVVQSFELLDR